MIDYVWLAIVKAPQGGPIYTHSFEDAYVSRIMDKISDSLDLENADSVEIKIEKIPA